jgi:predicted transcriptional regulator
VASPVLIREEAVSTTFEQHYSVQQVAKLWGLSEHAVRDAFEHEPGIVRLGNSQSTGRRRKYVTVRIPASVVERIHSRMTGRRE